MKTITTNPIPFSVPLSLRLSGSALKVIAVLSMLADHCAYYLMEHGTPAYDMMRCFGRMAFPLFAFLIAEGFANTRNRLRYLLTILGFAVISELPWYLLNGADGTHNVMFTLALGVVALAAFDRLCEHGSICFVSVMLVASLAWLAGTDYEWQGVVMITIFYILRRQTIEPWQPRNRVSFPAQSLRQVIFTFPIMAAYGLTGAILSSAIIFLYDGTRGCIKGAAAKYSFYAFYPLHIWIISIIAALS